MTAYKVATTGPTLCSRPVCPYPALPLHSGAGDTTKASSFVCVADEDHDEDQRPAPKYVNDGDNYPIVPITPPAITTMVTTVTIGDGVILGTHGGNPLL
jgi:hypothetical protein